MTKNKETQLTKDNLTPCEVWSSHGNEHQDYNPLGWTPCSLVDTYRHFGGTYRLHLHGRRMMGAPGSSRMLVAIYPPIQCCIPEDHVLEFDLTLTKNMVHKCSKQRHGGRGKQTRMNTSVDILFFSYCTASLFIIKISMNLSFKYIQWHIFFAKNSSSKIWTHLIVWKICYAEQSTAQSTAYEHRIKGKYQVP